MKNMPEETKKFEATLENCADEPIRTPGGIQPHGMLFALHSETYVIEQVSENCEEFLGFTPDELLGKEFLAMVGFSARALVEHSFKIAISHLANPFPIPFIAADEEELDFEGIAYGTEGGVIVLELEKVRSSHTKGKRLDDYFQMIERSLQFSLNVAKPENVADLMVQEVKSFTGFDRVMVYQFATNYDGKVIAEAKEEDMEPFLNLQYPATDIPAQARALYEVNTVRLLRTADAAPAAIVPMLHPRTGKPTDMTKSVLRAVSPIHLEYLKNMGVTSTLTISLMVRGKLWGLIACHHSKARYVPYGVRATAALYGVVMSSRLDAVEVQKQEKSQTAAHRSLQAVMERLVPADGLGKSLKSNLEGFVDIFKADGGAVVDNGKVTTSGSVPGDALILSKIEKLEAEKRVDPEIIQDMYARNEEFQKHRPAAAGLLSICVGEGLWVLIFRDEVVHEINWGGDPTNKGGEGSPGSLTPRKSFAAWKEKVTGTCAPWDFWTSTILDEFRSGVSKFLILREHLLLRSNGQLKNFSGIIAHEVRSQLQPPLMALQLIAEHKEGPLPEQLRKLVDMGVHSLDNLASFTTEMLDSADLEASHQKGGLVDMDSIARLVVAQTAETLGSDTKAISVEALPMVEGSAALIYHLLSNLVRNALIHGPAEPGAKVRVEIGVDSYDSTSCLLYVKDDGRGIAEEDREKIFLVSYRSKASKDRQGKGIGLGLVKQLIEQTGGKIWMDSELGVGTTFFIRLPSPAEN